LYIDDFKNVIVNFDKLPAKGNHMINIGSGYSVSVKEVADTVQQLFKDLYDKDIEVAVSDPLSESVPIDNALSIEQSKHHELQSTTTDFKTGLSSYITWAIDENIF